MQGIYTQHHLTTPALGKIEAMDKGNPEFVVEQGLYYPAATNYYGYYCTGFESPSEWDDHQQFFGVGGPDQQYSGLLVDGSPYVYYTPTVGYAHSPYNPYNPYVPGAILGVDGSFVGEQQYYAGPAYDHFTSSPTYYPLVYQSTKDSIPTNAPETYTVASRAIKPDGPHLKHPPSAHVGINKTTSKSSSGNVGYEFANTAYTQNRSLMSRHPLTHINNTSSCAPHSTPSLGSQGKYVSGSNDTSYSFSLGRAPSIHTPFESSLSVANGSSNSEAVEVGPRPQYAEGLNSGKTSSDFLREQNRGPRTNQDRNQWTISVKSYRNEAENHHTQNDVIIHTDQYNKDDFPVNFTDAKFFVIKSYSEDDVHKSIKYNVWSSTSNGNKRLASAYEDAQRRAYGKQKGCPIFLFFSVNASGQFCGVAEMIGPVDFHKDMDFWQHDKWNGSFPVKWHIIKDVPNNNLRHVILENNENRPVTSSRDTQDIRYEKGMEMLRIFKNFSMKTSILDDFIYYEDRQKIMMEEKTKFRRRNYTSSLPLDYSKALVDHSPSVGNKPQICDDPDGTMASANQQVLTVNDNSSSCELRNVAADTNDAISVLKLGSPTIDPNLNEESKSLAASETALGGIAVDIVTVGSVPIKINVFTDASSGTLNVGTIPIHLEGLKLDKSGRPSTGRSLQ